jgi:hypothetical protein
MKKTNLIIIVVVAIAGVICALLLMHERTHKLVKFAPEPPQQVGGVAIPAPQPDGKIQRLTIASVSQALTIYAGFTGSEILIDPKIQSIPMSFVYSNTQAVSRTDGIRLFEEALHKQDGLVFEHQDSGHIVIRQEKL